VLAQSTQRLTGGLFEYEDLGDVEAKGFPKPVRAWRVLREGTAESRFEALHGGAALTPLVGREEEIDLLLRRWRQAKEESEGRVVLLSGEAGIGKSRIARVIQERLAAEAHTRLFYFCSPHHEASALHPFIGRARQISSSTSWKDCSRCRAGISRATRRSWPRCYRSRAAAATRRGPTSARRSERRRLLRLCWRSSTGWRRACRC
jgi:AAA ATPase domain